MFSSPNGKYQWKPEENNISIWCLPSKGILHHPYWQNMQCYEWLKTKVMLLKKFSKLYKTHGIRLYMINRVVQWALWHTETTFTGINSCFYMVKLSTQNQWDNPECVKIYTNPEKSINILWQNEREKD